MTLPYLDIIRDDKDKEYKGVNVRVRYQDKPFPSMGVQYTSNLLTQILLWNRLTCYPRAYMHEFQSDNSDLSI